MWQSETKGTPLCQTAFCWEITENDIQIKTDDPAFLKRSLLQSNFFHSVSYGMLNQFSPDLKTDIWYLLFQTATNSTPVY